MGESMNSDFFEMYLKLMKLYPLKDLYISRTPLILDNSQTRGDIISRKDNVVEVRFKTVEVVHGL